VVNETRSSQRQANRAESGTSSPRSIQFPRQLDMDRSATEPRPQSIAECRPSNRRPSTALTSNDDDLESAVPLLTSPPSAALRHQNAADRTVDHHQLNGLSSSLVGDLSTAGQNGRPSTTRRSPGVVAGEDDVPCSPVHTSLAVMYLRRLSVLRVEHQLLNVQFVLAKSHRFGRSHVQKVLRISTHVFDNVSVINIMIL
jgi:hypothetical protein